MSTAPPTKIEAKSTLVDVDASGAFQRKPTTFRHAISADGPYPPVAGRYILYVSYACPWASRCLALRTAKGLEDVIALAVVSPTWARTRPHDAADTHEGWVFDPAVPGATPDPLGRCASIRDLYDLSMASSGHVFETRYTVPVLFDTVTNTIVNNESAEIIRLLNTQFNHLIADEGKRGLDLVPAGLRAAIDDMNEATYESLCNGVYRCGFAQSQAAYDAAVRDVFATLDRLDALLATQRYLVSDTAVTESDVRVFCCLVRFDEVYAVHFKCNKRLVHEYAGLMRWCRDVYHTLGLAPTVRMDHIKLHYYQSHEAINKYRVVPVGCDFMGMLEKPFVWDGKEKK